MASYTKRGDGWSVRWRDPDGTSRRRQVPNAATRDQLIREIEEAAALGRRWAPDRGRTPGLVAVTAEYLRDRARVWRPITLKNNEISLSTFSEWLIARSRRGHIGLDVLSRQLMADYWDYCRGTRRMGVATASRRIREAESFWSWCFDHDDYGGHTPRLRKLELPSAPQPVTRAPTWAQMDAVVVQSPHTHYERLFWLLRCTGLRKGQALALRWSDVDMERAELSIRPELGKTRAEQAGRVVPLAPVLVAEMAGWGTREGELIDWPGTRGPSEHTVQRVWQRARVPEEVWRRRSLHAFRKGFVSGLIGLGASREAVEFLVGHSMGVRGVYTDPSALALRETVALVPDRISSVRGVSKVPGAG